MLLWSTRSHCLVVLRCSLFNMYGYMLFTLVQKSVSWNRSPHFWEPHMSGCTLIIVQLAFITYYLFFFFQEGNMKSWKPHQPFKGSKVEIHHLSIQKKFTARPAKHRLYTYHCNTKVFLKKGKKSITLKKKKRQKKSHWKY